MPKFKEGDVIIYKNPDYLQNVMHTIEYVNSEDYVINIGGNETKYYILNIEKFYRLTTEAEIVLYE